MTTVHGCEGCATTAGQNGCMIHGPNAIGALALTAAVRGACPCSPIGQHTWTPQVTLPDGTVVIRCIGCRCEERFPLPDHSGSQAEG